MFNITRHSSLTFVFDYGNKRFGAVLCCNTHEIWPEISYPLHACTCVLHTVFCDAETTLTESMTYSWPRTLAGRTITLTCPTTSNVLVMRNCTIEGLWQTVADEGCDSVNEQLDMLNLSFTNVRVINFRHVRGLL